MNPLQKIHTLNLQLSRLQLQLQSTKSETVATTKKLQNEVAQYKFDKLNKQNDGK